MPLAYKTLTYAQYANLTYAEYAVMVYDPSTASRGWHVVASKCFAPNQTTDTFQRTVAKQTFKSGQTEGEIV